MERYSAMQRHAKHLIEEQAKVAVLNDGYWQQDATERARRDAEKASSSFMRGWHGGALDVLIDLHLEEAEAMHFEDHLVESDLIEAIKRAEADDGRYWAYIQEGGALCVEAWQRYTTERRAICAKADEDMTTADWQRLRDLNGWLIEPDED